MSAPIDTPRKLSSFDSAVISILGLIIIVGLGAILDAPLLISAVAGGVYFLAIQFYGRLQRPYDPPDPSLISNDNTAGIFDQRVIADSFSQAVWIINPREQIIYANKAAVNLFGPTPFGRRLATVMRDPAITQLVKTIFQDEPASPADYHMSGALDLHFRVTGTAINVEVEDDSPKKFAMLVFYDVTDFVKFALTQGDFLANASHELKTPVASLLGYIETLRGHAKDDPEARERFLSIMQQQARRMERLISDLLSLRQIEQNEHLAPIAAADIRAAANFALDTVSPLAQARGVSLDITGPDKLNVKGHQDQLVQLCLNLIDNAVKMTPEGGTVSLEVRTISSWRAQDFISFENAPHHASRQIVTPTPAPQGYAVLTIEDEGPGFAANHIPRLGERFYRIAGDRQSKDKGTGLGLAIVKHLVLRHRGGLSVTSTHAPDEDMLSGLTSLEETTHDIEASDMAIETGTRFTVIMPLLEPPILPNQNIS